MVPGRPEGRELARVGPDHVHLAEDAGLLVGDPGGVHAGRVLGRKQVPALPV